MRHTKRAVVVLGLAFVLGCDIETRLRARNPETVTQEARVEIEDENGQRLREIALGNIGPTEEREATFEVPKNGAFTLIGSLPQSAEISREQRTVTGSSDPFNVQVEMRRGAGDYLNDERSLDAISGAFRQLGPDVGIRATGIEDAVSTLLGALIVFTPSTPSSRGIVHYRLTPAELGVRQMTLEEIRYKDTREEETVKISGSAAAKVGASVPAFGIFGFSFSQDSVYELTWLLEGFGTINKPEDPARAPATRVQLLPEEQKQAIRSALARNPGSRLIYINSVYAVKAAEMSVTEGEKIGVEGKLDVGSIVTSSGAYKFSEERATKRAFRTFILAASGNDMVLDAAEAAGPNVLMVTGVGTDIVVSLDDFGAALSPELVPRQ